MSERDQVLADAVAKQDAPFLVAMTGNAAGSTWAGAAGERSPGQSASVDTVFRIFSMTKAVRSMAAMPLMDRGQLSADGAAESILPEFADLKLLDGFGPDGPRRRTPRVKATVRHLPRTPRAWCTSSGWKPCRSAWRPVARRPSCRGGPRR